MIVVGAGPAGLAAAIEASRRGCNVTLVEKTSRIGGIPALCLIHTFGGIFDIRGEILNPGLTEELVERLKRKDSDFKKRKLGRLWVLTVDPEIYETVMEEWIGECSRLKILKNSTLSQVTLKDGAIQEVELVELGQRSKQECDSIIDCTGNAEVAYLIGKAKSPEETNNPRTAMGFIAQLQNLSAGLLSFPNHLKIKRFIEDATRNGRLSPRCQTVWLDQGVRSNEGYIKFAIAPGQNLEIQARNLLSEVITYLKHVSIFPPDIVVKCGAVGLRDGRRIDGEYCLTSHDVSCGVKFADSACKGFWPIEYWKSEGEVTLKYPESDLSYDIPIRSLKVRDVNNLWAAGKCISADPLAQASLRVAGTCFAMGEAAGRGISCSA